MLCFLKIHIIPTSISPPVVHDDHEGAGEDNNDGPAEPVEQALPEPLAPVEQELRRSTRERRPPTRYPPLEYVILIDGGAPECFEEVMSHQHKNKWVKVMQEELRSLNENHAYDLAKLPKGKRALKNKWVYRLKIENNSQQRYKVRLVVKGFSQKKCIDFKEIFSPVVKMSSIRVVLGLTASLNLEIEQLGVKTTFLHGDLEKEIYMEQPEGFNVKGKKELVCKLKKSLYGLKQAPRQWYKKFDSFMENHSFSKTISDHCVFVKKFGENDFIILLLYMDDMLIVSKDASKIENMKRELSKSFTMKDLGSAKQIFGMKISRDRKTRKLWLSQEANIEKVLERFNMDKAKSVCSPLAGHFKLSSEHCPTSEKEK